jgi:ribosomal protein L11
MNWSMKTDRELIELAKTKTLEAIADHLKQPPKSILNKAKKLGLTIKRKGKTRK